MTSALSMVAAVTVPGPPAAATVTLRWAGSSMLAAVSPIQAVIG